MIAMNTVNADGSILIRSGDTISGICSKIYNIPASQTQRYWGEFGRKRYGDLVQIRDPNRIFAGETIYHLPTAKGQGASAGGAGSTTPPTPSPTPAAPVAAPKQSVSEYEVELAATNVWWGVGVDIQYTLGILGQQLMVFSLRSYDDPERVGLVFVENYKAGLSIDLTTNGYFVLATGLHHVAELHNQNSSEKLDWDFTLALGLNWANFIKTGGKSAKAAKGLAPVVETGTRMVRRYVDPELLKRVAKKIAESQMSRREKLIAAVAKHLTPTPDEVASFIKNLKTAIDEAIDIDFESAYPRVHFVPAVGGGTGLGVTRNFGQLHVLSNA